MVKIIIPPPISRGGGWGGGGESHHVREENEGECGVGHAKNNLRTTCAILMKLSPSEQNLLTKSYVRTLL